ncbi:MAG: DNA repair protein RadC [Pseudomonadota bacterium]
MRPRERYLLEGPEGFGDLELLALALGTGFKDLPVQEVAMGVLALAGGVEGLAALPVGSLVELRGLGPARAVRLHAAWSLQRRALARLALGPQVLSAVDAAAWFQPRLGGLAREELHALLLDRRHKVRAYRILTSGNDAHTIVDPRQVFREALLHRASAVIVAHNHPSGDPSPSGADVDVSIRLVEAGKLVGVELLDHLVLGGGSWTSLREQGLLPARGLPDTPVAASGQP